MNKEKFEMLVERAFDELPPEFKSKIENVHIVVEDLPDDNDLVNSGTKSKHSLLGLYHGVPFKHRNINYGLYPVIPDRIKLYKENIERVSRNEIEVEEKIREVLIHEVAHYFGMTDQEIRKAGY